MVSIQGSTESLYAEWKDLFDKRPNLKDTLFQRQRQEVSVFPVESYME
jgi:hypothetical protein